MMAINDIQADYMLYENGKNYNRLLRPDYYKTIDINEAFYASDQWRGVKSKGQPTLIMPLYKRIADHQIATILASPIKAVFTIENFDGQAENAAEYQTKLDMLNYQIQDKWEKDKIDSLLRDCLVDGFNSGDYAIYTYWDKNINTKQSYGKNVDGTDTDITGDFCNEIKDGAEIMLGNANDRRLQQQPYIVIVGRGMVQDLIDEAKLNGVKEEDYSLITSDLDYTETAGDRGKIELDKSPETNGKTLYVIKLWKKDGEVYYRKSTKFSPVIQEQSMGLKRYPLAWGNWTKRKNSYHGEAAGTALVPNQIAINQMYSNIVYHLRMTAFGKVIYDSSRISSWNNAIGSAIGVEGDITGAVQQLQAGQLNTNMFSFIGDMVNETKDLNGVNDAALGNVNPSTASASGIMANIQQAAIPLDNPKSNLYQFVEDLVLNWEDFIENKYKVPRKVGFTEDKVQMVGEINGSDYKKIPLSLKVEVGASTMWSEVTSINTILQLLATNRITFLQALERFPDGYIANKQGLIDEINKQNAAMLEQQQAPQGGAVPPESPQAPPTGQEQNPTGQNAPAPTGQSAAPDYEEMSKFVDTLAPEVQKKLQSLPDAQYEAAVTQLMAADKQGQLNPPAQGGANNG
jgi:hypothetical protein